MRKRKMIAERLAFACGILLGIAALPFNAFAEEVGGEIYGKPAPKVIPVKRGAYNVMFTPIYNIGFEKWKWSGYNFNMDTSSVGLQAQFSLFKKEPANTNSRVNVGACFTVSNGWINSLESNILKDRKPDNPGIFEPRYAEFGIGLVCRFPVANRFDILSSIGTEYVLAGLKALDLTYFTVGLSAQAMGRFYFNRTLTLDFGFSVADTFLNFNTSSSFFWADMEKYNAFYVCPFVGIGVNWG